ncbi:MULTISPECIES: hypothetical protein [unclassified Dysgonomonas]|uniref:hypothetical protein n=1 Tax=unclassified Dysgonomonas TaxID=2630389 RepID=UPI0013ED05E4|nr:MULTISPECIES: hypothetical protein [unclassified Dysgonomonas]
MKLRLIVLALISLVATSTFAQKKPTKAELDASNIIRFSNTVIALGNSYNETLKNYKSSFDNAENNLNRIKRNPNMQPFAIRCDVVSVQPRQQQEYTTALTGVQSFPEKDAIKKAVTEGENNMKSISQWCGNLSAYFSNKEYIADTEYTKYASIKDSLALYVNKAKQSWAEASKEASVAGSKAELILLESSPIASFVIPMKKDLIDLDGILNNLNREDVDITSIKSELSTLSATLEKNKDISTKDVSKLSDVYYKEVYQNYYRHFISCVSYLTKLADKIESQTGTSDEMNQLYNYSMSDYNKIIETYNTFIKQ